MPAPTPEELAALAASLRAKEPPATSSGKTASEIYAAEAKDQGLVKGGNGLPTSRPTYDDSKKSSTPYVPRDFDAENRDKYLAQGKADGYSFLDGRDPSITQLLASKGYAQLGQGLYYNPRTGSGYELDPKTGVLKFDASAYATPQQKIDATKALQGQSTTPTAGPSTSAAPGTQPPAAAKPPSPVLLPSAGRYGQVLDRGQTGIYPDNMQRLYIDPQTQYGRFDNPNLRDMSMLVPDSYNPKTAFQQNPITAGLDYNYDLNPNVAGDTSVLSPTGYGQAQINASTDQIRAGNNPGVGVGFDTNQLLTAAGYRSTGDPIRDSVLAAEIYDKQSSGADPSTYQARTLDDVNIADWDAGNSARGEVLNGVMSTIGGDANVEVKDTEGGQEFRTFMAKQGASTKMTDPFAIVNLKTGNRIIGSEYGQDEMLHVNNNRVAVQPMGKPMNRLPNMTNMMNSRSPRMGYAADGASIDTQQYYDDGTPVNGGVARQSQVNWANQVAPTTQPTGMSVADRERQASTAQAMENGYTPPTSVPYSYTNENQPASVGRQGGFTAAQGIESTRRQNAARGLDVDGFPLGTNTPAPTTTPPVTTPGGGNGGGGLPGGSGNNGGWPNTTVPNPTPAPIPNLPTTGTYPGTVPGTVQPTDPVAAATNWARDQRGRDIEGQYYSQFGLPRPREVTVPTMPSGVNPGAGLYYNTPDYGSQALGLQEQLAMLGNVGNSDAISQQIAGLRSGLTGDAASDSGIYQQIDSLNQELSRARQADEYRRQLGVLGVGGNTGMQRGPSDVIGPMPGEEPVQMPGELAAPVSQSTPDIPTVEFQRIHRQAPMLTASLLKADRELAERGDIHPEKIRQLSEMIASDPNPEAQQTGNSILSKIVARMNSKRPSPSPMGVSPMPEDPIAALAMAKFASAA